jgi:Type IV secretion system pilin
MLKKIIPLSLIFILIFAIGITILPNTAEAACPDASKKPADCKVTACGSGGWCGCSDGTTSEYSCMDIKKGTDCKTKLCPGLASNQCCKPAPEAEKPSSGPSTSAKPSGLDPSGGRDIPTIIGGAIKAVLGVAGAMALFMFVYGGLITLTSAGSPERIKKGKDVLIWATVGLIIIFGSFYMVDFVISGIEGTGSVDSPASIVEPKKDGAMRCKDTSDACVDDICDDPTDIQACRAQVEDDLVGIEINFYAATFIRYDAEIAKEWIGPLCNYECYEVVNK